MILVMEEAIGCYSLELAARVGRVKSLVLYGPSQTGKTTWARSLGAHIYQVGLLSGSECMKAPDVEYAVFDDIRGGMKFFPSFKRVAGMSTPCLCEGVVQRAKSHRVG